MSPDVTISDDFYWSPDTTTHGYQICTSCVMDTTDPEISFDESGQCSHCAKKKRNLKNLSERQASGELNLDELFATVKKAGKGRKYDAILGVSGGVDSSYLAYMMKENGIRPLAVHLDNGWDSELAVKNIQQIVQLLDIDLYTHVIDWEEFRDLQLSFVKASVIDIELLTDLAIYAVLYQQAIKHGVKYLIMGFNHATEGNMPRAWTHSKFDAVNLKAIHRKHGTVPIKSFPIAGNLTLECYYRRIRRIRHAYPLNYMQYDKQAAMDQLQNTLGWRPYRAKHYESSFTEFYQGYILPRKFGVDKRRPHLSALISAGKLSRDEAVLELQKPLFAASQLRQQYEFVLRKWGLSMSQFEDYLNSPPVPHSKYKTDKKRVELFRAIQSVYRRVVRAA